MVNVRPTNRKLAARAREVVAKIGGTGADEATRLLGAADGEVKTAILMARLNLEPDRAKRRLAEAGGSLSAALGR